MYRVLVVDDEPFITEGLIDIIEWSDYGLEIVGSAANGRDALTKLLDTPVDILLTDISMPIMDGLSLIREARRIRPHLKAIILSGFNDFQYIKDGLRLGVENYLLKPINVDELQETLVTTIDKLNATRADRLFSEYDIRILRDNILYRWLTGRIAPTELQERMDMLQIHMEKRFVVTAVLRADEQDPRSYEEAQRLIVQDPTILPFVDIDGDLVMVFMFNDPIEGKRIAKETLHRLRTQCMSSQLRISLGSVEEMGENVPRSFAHAKKAQEYFLLFNEPMIMEYDSLVQSDNEMASIVESLRWPDYVKLIHTKDIAGLHVLIDHEFDRVLAQPYITPTAMQSLAIELFIRFKMELQKIKQTEQPVFFETGFVRIVEAPTREELVSIVKEAADVTVQSFMHDVKSPVIQLVLDHVRIHYAEPLSLKVLGQQYNVHPVYLGHLFQKETNESFAEYLNKLRIEKAKALLKETPMKVSDIAQTVGYWETGYFYKQFKKYVGMSPTEFKGLL